MSNLVDSWLNGIGLGYAVPVFAGQGISSPEMLAELDIVDFPELGISDQNDRKKLFYLIQRVKLALARGQAAGTKGKKAAPQADSAVSSTSADAAAAAAAAAAAIEGGHRHREPAAGAKESQAVEHASSSSTALNSARFRRELEIPASPSRSALSSPRAATAGRNASAAAGGGGFRGAGGRPAAAKAQRLPPSHTRPKTPHADGTVRGSSHQQQREQSSVGARTSAPGASRARQKQQKQQQQQQQQQQLVGRLSAAAGSGAAISAVEHERSTAAAFSEKERQRVGGDCGSRRAPATAASETRSPRPKKTSEERRSVLEPVQLDETGGLARLSSFSSSTAAAAPAAATSERRLMPPRPSDQQHHGPAPGECTAQAVHPAAAAVSRFRTAVADETTVPPQPPRDTQEHSYRSSSGSRRAPPMRRRSPEGGWDAPPPHAPAAPPGAAAAATVRGQEVARLYPSKRDTAAAVSGSRSEEGTTARRTGSTNATVEPLPGAGRYEEQLEAPPSLPHAEEWGLEEDSDDDDNQAAAAAAAAAAVAVGENGRRESASELAMHLISAHRQDVKSALAAARKDMDLVSKADQDRHPAALIAYATEVEGVLEQRMAASARLRLALDSYWGLRQAAAEAAAFRPRPEGRGFQGTRLPAGGRALQA